MIRITLMDGSTQELPREQVKGLFAWRAPLTNPQLKTAGVIYHGGTLLPVHGPLAEESSGSIDDRAWLLVFEKHVQVIRGLPTFSDDLALNIVPERKRPAPALVESPAEEAEIFAPAAPTINAAAAGMAPSFRSEEEEEAQVLQELEELLRAS